MYEKHEGNQNINEFGPIFLDYIKGYLDKDLPQVSNLANFSAIVYDFFPNLNWAGFYLYDGKKLVLGPFQGKAACTSIELGSGVCGLSAQSKETIIVKDVHAFPGHIACDGNSMSEIVIPIFHKSALIGVLDVDSPVLDRFHQEEKYFLEKAVSFLIDIL